MPLIGDCSIIVNGSFETGHNLLGSDWEIFASLPPPGWVQGANGIPFEVQGSGAAGPGVNAQHGNFFVELDSDTEGNPTNPLPDINPTSNTNATIQQTVATDPGQTYELHFWYMPRPADGDANSSSMEVLWEGAVVHSINSSTAPAGWQEITLYLTAADASSILGFRGTGQQNELGAFIDNVRLCAIGVVDEDGLDSARSLGRASATASPATYPATQRSRTAVSLFSGAPTTSTRPTAPRRTPSARTVASPSRTTRWTSAASLARSCRRATSSTSFSRTAVRS